MDIGDRAQLVQQDEIDRAVSQRRPEQPAGRGRCLFCDEAGPERFCDHYCREDYIRLELKRENDRIVGALA